MPFSSPPDTLCREGVTAEAIGLVRSDPAASGWTRKRCGKGFTYKELAEATGEKERSVFHVNNAVQAALEKSKERKEGEKEELSGVIEKFVEKSKEITEQAAAEEAAMKKQKELDEATPF